MFSLQVLEKSDLEVLGFGGFIIGSFGLFFDLMYQTCKNSSNMCVFLCDSVIFKKNPLVLDIFRMHN